MNLTETLLVLLCTFGFIGLLVIGAIWGKIEKIERQLFKPVDFDPDTEIADALNRLEQAARDAARLAKETSHQVDVSTEQGRQSAKRATKIAADLADSISRADTEVSGEPGAAADAGLRSAPEEES